MTIHWEAYEDDVHACWSFFSAAVGHWTDFCHWRSDWP